MQGDEEKLKRLTQRYTRLTIICLFLMALLQGLHSFFLTIFFWLSVGFGALALNYYVAAKREAEPNVNWDGGGSKPKDFQKKKNLLVIVVSLMAGLLIFLSILVSIFSSTKSEDTQEQNTTNTGAQESQEATKENEPTVYQLASKEYDNQNYRQSISMCRQAIVRQPENVDLILLLGDNYGSLKQYDSSYIWFNKAYQLGARSAYLSHWMGYFYDEKGEASRAIEFYKDALRQDSSRAQIYDRLAEMIPDQADWYRQKSKQWSAK
jgi:tetratricopeptide (TPR) repeat protein